MGFWERFKRAAEAFKQEEEKEEKVVAFKQEEKPAVAMEQRESEEVIKKEGKKRRGEGRAPDPQSKRAVVFNAIKNNFLETFCSISDISSVLKGSLNDSQVGDALKDLAKRGFVTRKRRNQYFLTKDQAEQGRAYWGEDEALLVELSQEETKTAVFKQEEEKTAVIADRESEVVEKKKREGRYMGRALVLQSNRGIVFNVMGEKFLDRPCSLQDISSVLIASLKKREVSDALSGLCRDGWISCEKGLYLLTACKKAQREEKAKKYNKENSYPLIISLPKALQEMIMPFLSERWPGEGGLRADIAAVLAGQVAKREPILTIELEEVRRALKKEKRNPKCYTPIPVSLYKSLKELADEAGCSLSRVALCLILRWYYSQERGKKEQEKPPQYNQTVARWLRMEMNKDLGEFCKDVGIDPTKYSHWERGEPDWDRLRPYELTKLASYLEIKVGDIATPDGRPVFLYE